MSLKPYKVFCHNQIANATYCSLSGSALVPYHKHEVVPHHSNRNSSSNSSNHYQPPPPPKSYTQHNGVLSPDAISAVTPVSTTVLPPIGVDYATTRNFPMSPPVQARSKYVIQAPPSSNPYEGFNGHADPSQLPAILQSSLGKLEMNFVQNKSLEVPPQPYLDSLEMPREGKGLMRSLEGPPPNTTTDLVKREEGELEEARQHPKQNGGPPATTTIKQQANGVLKVAMYGEFPITATTTAVTRTNQS